MLSIPLPEGKIHQYSIDHIFDWHLVGPILDTPNILSRSTKDTTEAGGWFSLYNSMEQWNIHDVHIEGSKDDGGVTQLMYAGCVI